MEFTGKITTSTGLFDVRNPKPNTIHLADIAVGLSNESRFAGHTSPYTYSVAAHSLFCAAIAEEMQLSAALIFEAVLHDASEAYLGDMPSPIKAVLPDFQALEKNLQSTIARHFNLPEVLSPEIVEIDRICLSCEIALLFSPAHWDLFGVQVAHDEWFEFALNYFSTAPGLRAARGSLFDQAQFFKKAQFYRRNHFDEILAAE